MEARDDTAITKNDSEIADAAIIRLYQAESLTRLFNVRPLTENSYLDGQLVVTAKTWAERPDDFTSVMRPLSIGVLGAECPLTSLQDLAQYLAARHTQTDAS